MPKSFSSALVRIKISKLINNYSNLLYLTTHQKLTKSDKNKRTFQKFSLEFALLSISDLRYTFVLYVLLFIP